MGPPFCLFVATYFAMFLSATLHNISEIKHVVLKVLITTPLLHVRVLVFQHGYTFIALSFMLTCLHTHVRTIKLRGLSTQYSKNYMLLHGCYMHYHAVVQMWICHVTARLNDQRKGQHCLPIL